MYRKDRFGNREGGGFMAFVSNITSTCTPELESDNVLSLWLNINLYNSKHGILFGAMYLPPGSIVEADNKLELNIEAAYLRNRETCVLEDFNIKFLNCTAYIKHHLAKALKGLNLTQTVETVTLPVLCVRTIFMQVIQILFPPKCSRAAFSFRNAQLLF